MTRRGFGKFVNISHSESHLPKQKRKVSNMHAAKTRLGLGFMRYQVGQKGFNQMGI